MGKVTTGTNCCESTATASVPNNRLIVHLNWICDTEPWNVFPLPKTYTCLAEMFINLDMGKYIMNTTGVAIVSGMDVRMQLC